MASHTVTGLPPRLSSPHRQGRASPHLSFAGRGVVASGRDGGGSRRPPRLPPVGAPDLAKRGPDLCSAAPELDADAVAVASLPSSGHVGSPAALTTSEGDGKPRRRLPCFRPALPAAARAAARLGRAGGGRGRRGLNRRPRHPWGRATGGTTAPFPLRTNVLKTGIRKIKGIHPTGIK
uniref:Uncharacterized protein n=1 Tax=Oryza sativa subsp. japonica TaxID=39947 RepID=Q6K298_ORYSJ|nr:hypothetical protein [Oryza sativa Japonica Group]BAD22490.1 hypothetical protein [Oryza sativa Japonica Group]